MNAKTREILNFFKDISSIPRCWGNEEKFAKWLQQWADEKGYAHQSDSAGNLKTGVGASPGFEEAPGIVLQGHMDMVCEKSLDSETEGVFTVGCAGGQDVRIEKELAWTDIPDTTELFKLNMQGLTGGHSGIDIHRGRANANKLLARALHYIRAACQIRLISFKGGTARKAIPRDATAAIACEAAHIRTMQNIVSDFKQTLTNEYGALAGAECRRENDYPPWQPDMDAALLKRCTDLYRKLFDREPVVQAIHAGLECAIIGSKYPGMQIISLGPTMEKAHSPDERLYIPSIERLWRFLAAYCSLSGSKNITQGIGFLS